MSALSLSFSSCQASLKLSEKKNLWKNILSGADARISSLSFLSPSPSPLNPTASYSPAVRRAYRPQWRWTDRWKARGRRQGTEGRMEERERCDPHSRALSIYRRKCPNWQAAGSTTALHWYPTPCPSPPQPSLLLVPHHLLPPPLSSAPLVPYSTYIVLLLSSSSTSLTSSFDFHLLPLLLFWVSVRYFLLHWVFLSSTLWPSISVSPLPCFLPLVSLFLSVY